MIALILAGIIYGPLSYDFGPLSSPVSPGMVQVTGDTRYSSTTGYGWLSGSVSTVDRGPIDTPYSRDFAETSDAVFAVSLPAGTYSVTFTTGDVGSVARDRMSFAFQGGFATVISTNARQLVTRTTDVTVGSDQILKLRISGRLDNPATIESLLITTKVTPLRVSSLTPVMAASFDRIVMTFNQPTVDPGLSVVSFVGPNGSISRNVIRVSPNRYGVVLSEQKIPGSYTIVISSPQLDQNGDGKIGTADDIITHVVTISQSPPTIYVATTGSDLSQGSLSDPVKTLGKALEKAMAGSTIYLRAGSYVGGVTINKLNTSILSYADEKVVITVPSDDVKVSSNIVVASAGFSMKRIEIVGGYYYGIKFEVGKGLLENMSIHNTGRDCIKIVPDCDDIVIRKCEIYRSGLRESNADGIDNVNGDRMIVQDCYIHDIVGYGVFGKGGAKDVVIERNYISNAAAGVYLGGFTDVEFFDSIANPFLIESIDCVVRNNTIVNTDYAGIGFAGAIGGKVTGNILINTANVGQGEFYFAEVTHYFNDGSTLPCPTTACIVNGNVTKRTMPGTRFSAYLAPESMGNDNAIDENTYENGGLPTIFFDGRGWKTGLTWYRSFATWRSINGYDLNGQEK